MPMPPWRWRASMRRRRYDAALAIWGPLARAGQRRAQNNVGACFAEGLGVERDARLAHSWLTLSAEAGDRWPAQPGDPAVQGREASREASGAEASGVEAPGLGIAADAARAAALIAPPPSRATPSRRTC